MTTKTDAPHGVSFPLTILSLKRLKNSINGNPTWEVTFTNGTTFVTAPDASISYVIDGLAYRGVPLHVSFVNGKIGMVVQV